jgi:transcriptional regulator with XRE-family HTH domain
MFWNNFEALCAEKGVSYNAAAADVGVKSSGTVTGWKNGAKPRGPVLKRLADYFDVTVEELTGENEQKEKPTPSEESELNARFDALLSQMTDADRADLLEYMEFKVAKRKENPNG